MPPEYLGALYALLASVCFAIGPTLNTLAGRHVRVATVNRVRLAAALLLLMLVHWLTLGSPFPITGRIENWMYMGLSGIFGLIIGDALLFGAFNVLGTRLSMLVISLIPMFSSLMAYFFLDEKLAVVQVVGIAVTISGVGWVLLDRRSGATRELNRRVYLRGFLLAIGSAFFHAAAAITSKAGLAGDFPALSAHTIRTFLALILIMIPLLSREPRRGMVSELRQKPEAMKYLLWGAVFGPLLGMWLALLALQHINVGIATAITSLPPIWLIPVGRFFFNERIGWRAVAGSLTAVSGVALMFLF
jgi:drug/metabolite transporter (DMT)-like permease